VNQLTAIDDRQDNSGGNVGNIYDSIEDVSTASTQNLSASGLHPTPQDETAAASVGVDACGVYIHPVKSMNDVPCFYQTEPHHPNTKPNDLDSDNNLQDVDESAASAYVKISEHNEGESLPTYAQLTGKRKSIDSKNEFFE